MTLLALAGGLVAGGGSASAAEESSRWVLMDEQGRLAERFGSTSSVLITGSPSREGGEYIPVSDVYVTVDQDWAGRDGEGLQDVSNPDGVPNTVVGFEVAEHPVYLPTLRTGRYDVVVDDDQDGVFDEGADDVIGAGERAGFTVFFNGSVSSTHKQQLKEAFAAPYRRAATDAARIAAVVSLAGAGDDGAGWGEALGSAYVSDRLEGQSVAYTFTTNGALLLKGVDYASGRQQALEHATGQVRAAAAGLAQAAYAIEADPPDPEYAEVAPVVPVGPAYPEATGDALGDRLARLANRSDDATALFGALLHAIERYDGAALDDARDAMRRQAAAIRDLTAQSRAVVTAAAAAADDLEAELVRAGVPGAVDDQQREALQQLRDRLAADGFTSAERQVLRDAGVDAALEERLRGHLVASIEPGLLPASLAVGVAGVRDVRHTAVAGLWDLETQAANLVDELARQADDGGDPDEPAPPVAADDDASGVTDEPVVVHVLENDTDPAGGGLALAGHGGAGHGGVSCYDSSCTYQAYGGFTGTDSFTYTARDVRDRTTTATVRVSVAASTTNRAPVAEDDVLGVPQDRSAGLYAVGNDTDPDGDHLTITATDGPAHGSADCYGGYCAYYAERGYTGPDAFSYTVSDGRGGTDTAVVQVVVHPNASPTPADDELDAVVQTTSRAEVRANDSDPDGDAFGITGWTQPARGAVDCDELACRYTGAPGFVGSDAFTYTVTDERGATGTATVSVDVRPNTPPVVADDRMQVRAGRSGSLPVLVNDRDPDGHPLTVTGWSLPANGTVACAEDRCRYTPHSGFSGTDAFTYTATDGLGGSATAQVRVGVVPDPADARSTGTDFWLAFPTNYGAETADDYRLYVSAPAATKGLVTVPGLGVSTAFDVIPGQVTTVELPAQVELAGEGVQARAVHVATADPVSVYALSRQQFTTDAFLALPSHVAGREHLVLGWGYSYYAQSELAVVATEDDTTVTVGQHATVTLDQGDAYQYQSTSDVTGTVVTADKPVQVLGGHACANIPTPQTGYCDHVVEMLPPTSGWGRQFVTVPLAGRLGGDTFRVLAAEDGTTVSVDGQPVAQLGRGEAVQRSVEGMAVLTADRPVLVAQYSNGTEYDGVTSDPFMMLVPPHEQFLDAYTVTTPASGFRDNHVNLAVPLSAVGEVTLDGTALPADRFRPIGDSGFAGLQQAVPAGAHVLAAPQPFGAFVYGFDDYDSYGYPGGMSLSEVARVTSVTLTPSTQSLRIGTRACVEVAARDQRDRPVAGVRVTVTRTGAHQDRTSVVTGEDGTAPSCSTGAVAGRDQVTAELGTLRATAEVVWTAPVPTALAAEPAVVRVAGTASRLYAPDLVARLTAAGAPVAGRRVVMSAGGADVCTAVSDASGTARCGGVLPLVATVLAQGWTATFSGDYDHLASTGRGTLVAAEALSVPVGAPRRLLV